MLCIALGFPEAFATTIYHHVPSWCWEHWKSTTEEWMLVVLSMLTAETAWGEIAPGQRKMELEGCIFSQCRSWRRLLRVAAKHWHGKGAAVCVGSLLTYSSSAQHAVTASTACVQHPPAFSSLSGRHRGRDELGSMGGGPTMLWAGQPAARLPHLHSEDYVQELHFCHGEPWPARDLLYL